MVTVRINSTGQELDVIGSINYVKQIADVGDITTANSSYTWQLKFPKSPKNTQIFQGLGIAGSNSQIPYQKIVCQILDNGIMIEPNGNLIITATENEYIGHVKAGLIDFLQDISNDLISNVINLSSLTHQNTVNNIIDSFTADLPYKYIVAYYNGQLLPDQGGVTNLNPFALVPSINLKYLWDRIFEYYGWTYSGNFDISDLWMTYPNAIGYSEEGSTLAMQASLVSTSYPAQRLNPIFISQYNINSIDTDFVEQQGVFFVIQQPGQYKLKATIKAQVYSPLYGFLDDFTYFRISTPYTNYEYLIADGVNEFDFDITAQTGTLIYLQAFSDVFLTESIVIQSGELSIIALGVQDIDFSEALIKVKVKDFFKEIMVRNSLTPFVDVENKAIRFRTLDERLNAPVVNWSSKYAGRTSEKYVYQSYAQQNLIKHKYNEPNENWGDGILVVNNQNQPPEKTLYQSFTYAPNEELVEYNGVNFPSYFVQNFRMFDVEVQVDENDDLIANYKQLKDRFYIIRAEQRTDSIYVLGNLATEFPLAIYSEVFADIVLSQYFNMNQLIDNAKIETIDLVISKPDIVNLDFFRRYYFEQEKAYFLLNKLTWKSGEICTAEFIKINS